MGFPIKNGWNFHSYVKLPEGKQWGCCEYRFCTAQQARWDSRNCWMVIHIIFNINHQYHLGDHQGPDLHLWTGRQLARRAAACFEQMSGCLFVFLGDSPALASGKHTKNYGKSPVSMGKSTISMAIFSSKLLVITRG